MLTLEELGATGNKVYCHRTLFYTTRLIGRAMFASPSEAKKSASLRRMGRRYSVRHQAMHVYCYSIRCMTGDRPVALAANLIYQDAVLHVLRRRNVDR